MAIRIYLTAFFLWAASFNTHAAIIYESSTLGTTGSGGGFSLNAQYLGTRFTLDSSAHITGIGGHIVTFAGTVWGALFELPAASPSSVLGTDSDLETNALASALFTSTGSSSDLISSVDVTLNAGDYALIFGGNGLFGSTGTGAMPGNDSNLPGASYFFRNGGGTWNENGFSSARFVVEGSFSAVSAPASLVLLSLGLALLGFTRRAQSKA